MNEIVQKLNNNIVEFLDECRLKNWELDSDDITHILVGDFDYVRKQNDNE